MANVDDVTPSGFKCDYCLLVGWQRGFGRGEGEGVGEGLGLGLGLGCGCGKAGELLVARGVTERVL